MSDLNKKIKGYVDSIVDALATIRNEQERIKEIAEAAEEDIAIDPKKLKQLARFVHKQNLTDTVEELEEIVSLYESLYDK